MKCPIAAVTYLSMCSPILTPPTKDIERIYFAIGPKSVLEKGARETISICRCCLLCVNLGMSFLFPGTKRLCCNKIKCEIAIALLPNKNGSL